MPEGHLHRLAGDRPPRPQVRVRLATPAVAWGVTAPATCELHVLRAESLFRAGPHPSTPATSTPVETWELAGRRAYARPRCQPG